LDWFNAQVAGNPHEFIGKKHGFLYIDFPLNQSNDMFIQSGNNDDFMNFINRFDSCLPLLAGIASNPLARTVGLV